MSPWFGVHRLGCILGRPPKVRLRSEAVGNSPTCG